MPTLEEFIPLVIDIFAYEAAVLQKNVWVEILSGHDGLGLE